MRSPLLVGSALFGLMAVVDTAAHAGPPPAAHFIFLTSTAYTGALGGLHGADDLCAAHAASGTLTQPLGLAWRALLSIDGVVDARDRLVWSGPVYDVTGQLVTIDPGTWPWTQDGTSTLEVDEDGGPPPDPYVWTGSDVTGVSVGPGLDCNGWTDGTGSFNGWSGESGSFDSDNWIDSFSSGCGDPSYSLYCVSEFDPSLFADDFELGTVCKWSDFVGSTDLCVPTFD